MPSKQYTRTHHKVIRRILAGGVRDLDFLTPVERARLKTRKRIVQLYGDGYSMEEIAGELVVSRSQVSKTISAFIAQHPLAENSLKKSEKDRYNGSANRTST